MRKSDEGGSVLRVWLVPMVLWWVAAVAGQACAAPKTMIHELVADGDAGAVQRHLAEQPAAVEARSEDGQTPLHIACYTKDLAMVRLLLTAGADANARDDSGGVALHYACGPPGPKDAHTLQEATEIMVEIVRLLLGHGAEANAKGDGGYAPLHPAAGSALPHLVRLLLRNGADAEVLDSDGETPLYWALRSLAPESAEALLAGGADPAAHAEGRLSAFAWALRRPRARMPGDEDEDTAAEIILEFMDLQVVHAAARDGDLELLKEVLGQDAELVNARAGMAWTPLHWAAWMGRTEAARLLLEKGADPELRDDSELSPLDLAASRDKLAVVRLLADAVTDVGAKGAAGRSALHWAATCDSAAAAHLLIRAGVAVDARDAQGLTPLHLAAETGRLGAAFALLQHGADPTAEADAYEGYTPIRAAQGTRDADMVELIASVSEDPTGETKRTPASSSDRIPVAVP